jgi:hypothetical protein
MTFGWLSRGETPEQNGPGCLQVVCFESSRRGVTVDDTVLIVDEENPCSMAAKIALRRDEFHDPQAPRIKLTWNP